MYGRDKPLSVISQAESFVLYFLVRMMKPETVLETGVSDGMSSLFILLALRENKFGHLFSIDFPDVGMSSLFGLDPGWTVPMEIRGRWSLIYRKTSKILIPLLKTVNKVDVFDHDSEHLYYNMIFEFTSVLKFMKDGSLLLSEDVRSNNAFHEALELSEFRNRIGLMIGEGPDFGGTFLKQSSE